MAMNTMNLTPLIDQTDVLHIRLTWAVYEEIYWKPLIHPFNSPTLIHLNVCKLTFPIINFSNQEYF